MKTCFKSPCEIGELPAESESLIMVRIGGLVKDHLVLLRLSLDLLGHALQPRQFLVSWK